MTTWLLIAAGVVVPVLFMVMRYSLKREQRAEDRAAIAEQDADDLKTYVGKNFKREANHAKRIERISSGASRVDAGRMLSTYPTPDPVAKTRKARP